MQKTSIHPSILQEHLDSGSNAAAKGQAQYHTPAAWARVLALPLPNYRPVIVDLTCGNGQLLAGAKRGQSKLLGCDIQPHEDFVAADLTQHYSLLRAVKFQADLFVLNLPWDIHWHRDRLQALRESACPAVRDAFKRHDGRTAKHTIDSTVAGHMIALDLSSRYGEGLSVANEATLQRLIFGKDAPHAELGQHVWAHLTIDGNICDGKAEGGMKNEEGGFKTGVIYFARDHYHGPKFTGHATDIVQAERLCITLGKSRLQCRKGAEVTSSGSSDQNTKDTEQLWNACAAELATQNSKLTAPSFNLWLGGDGHIHTQLSVYDEASERVKKSEAAILHGLNGKHPLQLVVQKPERAALERAVLGVTPWTVCPKLQAAVKQAVADYNLARSPLRPLPKITRLGFLDELEAIQCVRSLRTATGGNFRAGQSYPLRSCTVSVKRQGTKMNLIGLRDTVEWDGQELAFFLTDESGTERVFMEERLRDQTVKVNLINPGEHRRRKDKIGDECPIDFTLQQLVKHFHIPEVPDVAMLFPDRYGQNLKLLAEIETLCAPFQFKPFQRDDYARLGIPDGAIGGHDTGLGKTMLMFVWPCLKVGLWKPGQVVAEPAVKRFNPLAGVQALACPPDSLKAGLQRGLRPAQPVLLVVPGDGHDQTDDESLKHFQVKAVRLDSQAAFLRESKPDPRTGRRTLPPGYYLTSYTQLGVNGVAEFPGRTMAELKLTEDDAVQWFADRGVIYKEHYVRFEATPATAWKDIHTQWLKWRKVYESNNENDQNAAAINSLDDSYHTLKRITPKRGGGWTDLDDPQREGLRADLVSHTHREWQAGIGHEKSYPHGVIQCVYSPTLADYCQSCFGAIVVDEGTKIQGDATLIGLGVRQIGAPFRMVMSGTPIKNRFPQIFHLASYVCGAFPYPTARWPYGRDDSEQFAEDFMVSERNLSKEDRAQYAKRTPQVCNIHRAWKVLAPILLRRRKDDCGEDIVPKVRHTVRVPMGRHQAEVYAFHLAAKYKDHRKRPAIGPKLQALRMAAANPASRQLVRPEGDMTKGEPRSLHSFIPKVASALTIIHDAMLRREQVIIGSAFQGSLDVLSARLNEAGVKHLVMDGRISQAKRGTLARLFKQGPPRAVDAGLVTRHSEYPVMLAGVECMAELHNFYLCNNVAIAAYSWAWDKLEQFINRAHRMNSPWPVNLWSIICDGSMDMKLDSNLHEKGNAAELVLDGRLLGENTTEVNLAELLHLAKAEFAAGFKTVDERELEKGWPKLRAALSKAVTAWKPTRTDFPPLPGERAGVRADVSPINLGVRRMNLSGETKCSGGSMSAVGGHRPPLHTRNPEPKTLNREPLWRQRLRGRVAVDNSAFTDLPLFNENHPRFKL